MADLLPSHRLRSEITALLYDHLAWMLAGSEGDFDLMEAERRILSALDGGGATVQEDTPNDR